MYRIVHNELTGAYRVEKRGLLGWAFVTSQDSGDYLDFDSYDQACRWIGRKNSAEKPSGRRWKTVSVCDS